MNATRRMLSCTLVAALLGACSGPGMSREAQATQEAAHAYATQTAAAPTATSVPTRTPRPTPTRTPLPTPTALPGLEVVILRVTDLPAGYAPIPLRGIVSEPGEQFVTGDVIETSFAFGRMGAASEIIAGMAARLDPAINDAGLDPDLQYYIDMMAATINAGLGEDSAGPPQPLEGVAGIGEDSAGATLLSDSGGTTTQIDLLMFRRADVAVMMYMVYLEGTTPELTLLEAARLIDERIASQLAGGPGPVVLRANALTKPS